MTTPEIKKTVSRFFPYLKEKDMDTFLNITKYKVFKSKEMILNPYRNDKLVILILKGSARAYSIKNGVELNSHLCPEGVVFADPRVLSKNIPLLLNIESIEETHGLLFNIETLEDLGYQHRGLMEFYLNIIKVNTVTLAHRVYSFVTMTSEERYHDLLEWNPAYLGSTYYKHIASFLGITRLTLHRIMKKRSTK